VPTPSLYTREKNPTGVWRYKRVKEGRGVKTGDLGAPFFTRPSVHSKQLWKTLSATTFKQAKEEAAQLTAALDAQAKGLVLVPVCPRSPPWTHLHASTDLIFLA
jgi:hypothetical protein